MCGLSVLGDLPRGGSPSVVKRSADQEANPRVTQVARGSVPEQPLCLLPTCAVHTTLEPRAQWKPRTPTGTLPNTLTYVKVWGLGDSFGPSSGSPPLGLPGGVLPGRSTLGEESSRGGLLPGGLLLGGLLPGGLLPGGLPGARKVPKLACRNRPFSVREGGWPKWAVGSGRVGPGRVGSGRFDFLNTLSTTRSLREPT